MNHLVAFCELVLKELKQLFSSVGATVTLLAQGVISLFLLAYATTMDLRYCPFTVLDRENTSETRALAARFENADVFQRLPDIRDEAELTERIDGREARMAIVFPPGFTRSRKFGILIDGRNAVTAGSIANYASAIVEKYNERRYEEKTAIRPAVKFQDRGWFNPDYRPEWFEIPCLMVELCLQGLAMAIALSLAKERELGNLDQLRLTPFTPFELLLAKGFAGAVVGVGQLLPTLVCSILVFHVPFTGSIAAMAVMIASFIASAAGLGLLASAFCKTQQQASIMSIVVAVPFALLSGMTTPINCMPGWLQYSAWVNPLAWAVIASQKLFLEGGGLTAIAPSAFALFIIGAVSFLFAWLKFRKE